ncbi:MAG TPA: hypothetical protein VG820_04675 [Fimbriimonadaceae bacterium]|nr:hypothetical protein [Fimbriimonadaceae bacterium]
MATPRWWLKPGELAWVGNVSGLLWRLFYEGDDGDLWAFSVRNGDHSPSDRFRFDHRSLTLVSDGADRRIPSVLGAVHRTLERRVGLLVTPESFHRRIIDEIARHLSKDDWIDGKLLRRELKPSPPERSLVAIRELIPRYVRQLPPSDFHGEIDHYSLTLRGALESSRTTEVSRVVDGVLRLLAKKFDTDPTFSTYTLAEVRAQLTLSDESAPFAHHVIRVAGLTHGGYGSSSGDQIFGTPPDIEALAECPDFFSFLEYLRGGKSDRPSPTAPLVLPDDRQIADIPDPAPLRSPVAPVHPAQVTSTFPNSPIVRIPAGPAPRTGLSKLWHDPVWSKVIATGIVAAISTAFLLFRHRLGL